MDDLGLMRAPSVCFAPNFHPELFVRDAESISLGLGHPDEGPGVGSLVFPKAGVLVLDAELPATSEWRLLLSLLIRPFKPLSVASEAVLREERVCLVEGPDSQDLLGVDLA